MLHLNSQASNLVVQEYKDRWEAKKVYSVVPLETQILMQGLIRASLAAESSEDAKAILVKALEVMDWIWPLNTPQSFTVLQYEDVEIRVPLRR